VFKPILKITTNESPEPKQIISIGIQGVIKNEKNQITDSTDKLKAVSKTQDESNPYRHVRFANGDAKRLKVSQKSTLAHMLLQ
jgi:hypothetical protein